jgi:hypothetical protein
MTSQASSKTSSGADLSTWSARIFRPSGPTGLDSSSLQNGRSDGGWYSPRRWLGRVWLRRQA